MLDIKQKTLSGLKWSAASKTVVQVVNWSSTIIVIRFLTPEDYGLLALAMLLVSFLTLLYEMGLGAAIVQAKNISRDELKDMFGVILVINLALFLLSFFSAVWVAQFFDAPRLIELIQVLSFKFILVAFSVIPSSLLLRRMDFKHKSILDLVATLIGTITTLTMAISGYGVWSLVVGSMASSVISLIGLWVLEPFWAMPSLNISRIKDKAVYGGVVTLERIVWYFYTQVDSLIVGKFLGKADLGHYSVAMQLSSLPMQKLNGIINQVAFAAFSKVQDDLETIKVGLRKSIKVISFICFPVFLGISLTAEHFVPIVLGDQWLSAIVPIVTLSLIMPFRMISNIFPTLLRAAGKPTVSLGNLLIASFIMPVSFLIGVEYGIEGVCYAWLIAYPIVFLVEVVRTFRAMNIELSLLMQESFYPVLAALVMAAGVYVFKMTFNEVGIPLLVSEIVVGVVLYLLTVYIFDKGVFREFKSYI